MATDKEKYSSHGDSLLLIAELKTALLHTGKLLGVPLQDGSKLAEMYEENSVLLAWEIDTRVEQLKEQIAERAR